MYASGGGFNSFFPVNMLFINNNEKWIDKKETRFKIKMQDLVAGMCRNLLKTRYL